VTSVRIAASVRPAAHITAAEYTFDAMSWFR
jgi:hypothetical protein